MGHDAYKHKHEIGKLQSHSSFFVFCFVSVFICAALLATLRLYGLYLEHRISQTASRVEQYKEDNLEMSKRFSELLSPAKVYSYARKELGMTNAENIMTVKLADSSVRTKEESPAQVTNAKLGFLDYINPFLSSAHAKN